MQKHFESVREFALRAGQGVPTHIVNEIPEKERILRARLLLEETIETIHALGLAPYFTFHGDDVTVKVGIDKSHIEFVPFEEDGLDGPFEMNVEEVLDGVCDVRFVATGIAVALGIEGRTDRALQSAVDQSNLEKFGPGHTHDRYGKLVKPPNWKKPDFAGILRGEYNRVPAK